MGKLLLATRSKDKAREIGEILGAGVEIVSLDDAHLSWSEAEERLEEQDTFLANARSKAAYFAKLSGLPTVADDSGLEVVSLGGVPGARSKRFAPEAYRLSGPELDAANNAELLRRLLGAETSRRRASYVCVAVLIRNVSTLPEAFTGRCWGFILDAPKGANGFGYDPLFFHQGLGKTFGEASAVEKHGVSHRGAAFRELATALAAEPLR